MKYQQGFAGTLKTTGVACDMEKPSLPALPQVRGLKASKD